MSMHQFVKLFCLNYQAYSPTLLVGKLSNIRLYERLGYEIFKEEAVSQELQFVYLQKC